MVKLQNPLWVVTTYFNPAGYRRRRANFDAFRRHINAPLLVVELSGTSTFELSKSDGDIVVQLVGEDALWQKERLINIGLTELPSHVEFVAWVDCDVIFGDPNWASRAQEILENRGGLLQLFDRAIHLGHDLDPSTATRETCRLSAPLFHESSIAPHLKGRQFDFGTRIFQRMAAYLGQCPVPDGPPTFSMAWSAIRSVIQQAGLYDRNIVGGGDTVNLLSSERDLISYQTNGNCTSSHPSSILDRIERANALGLFQDFNCLDQDVFHLWHGDVQNRKYRERHAILVDGGFNPLRDITTADNGTLRWTNPSGSMALAVRDYFRSRREDG